MINKLNKLYHKFKKLSANKKIKYVVLSSIIIISLNLTYNTILGYLSENWKETEATIVKAESGLSRGKSLGNEQYENYFVKDLGGTYYSITYQYKVNGKIYESNRAAYPDIIYPGIVGNKLAIYYWDIFPSFSVIEKGSHVGWESPFIITFLLIIYFFAYIEDAAEKRSG